MKIFNDGTHLTNTGRIRYRTSWFGKLILQVQYRDIDMQGDIVLLWRDATVKDIDMNIINGSK